MQQFAQYLETLGCSPHTIRAYTSNVTRLVENGVADKYFSKFDANLLVKLPISTSIKKMMVNSAKKYVRFLISCGQLERIPDQLLAVELPKIPVKIPRITKPETVNNIISTTKSLKLKAALYILATTGCRISSLVGINVTDIDFDNNKITFKVAKGCKEYSVPLTSGTKQIILQYLDGRIVGSLFNATEGSMRMALKRALGLNYCNCHSVRHGFATSLIENGCEITTVKEVLNHVSISTTQKYIHLSNEIMQQKLNGKYSLV